MWNRFKYTIFQKIQKLVKKGKPAEQKHRKSKIHLWPYKAWSLGSHVWGDKFLALCGNKLWYLVELATWIAPVAFKINSNGYLDAIAARYPPLKNKKRTKNKHMLGSYTSKLDYRNKPNLFLKQSLSTC